MKITADPRLFWFLKEKARLDLNKPSSLDLYAQQVLTRGRSTDVKELLAIHEPQRKCWHGVMDLINHAG